LENTGQIRQTSTRKKLVLTVVLLGALVAIVIATLAAFSSVTSNTGNSFDVGTVELTDNDSDTAMLSIVGGRPGDSDESCITVTYSGTLASSVRLYGTTTGTGLDQYLDLVVTRGTGAAGFDDCTGFTPDAGGGVLYNGTLQGFPDSYAAGIVDPATWNESDSHDYRFTVVVQDNDGAQGLTATQAFTWEARNN
jgi:predicted ribosomally synthesized peptide with SipW-like signal peptide